MRGPVADAAFVILGAVLVLGGTLGICALGARWVTALPPGESALWPVAVTVVAAQVYLPAAVGATFWAAGR